MGKIVKYCAACEESFAEKFAFCPNCGKSMEAFEMNPLKDVANSAVEVAPIVPAAEVAPIVSNNISPVTNDNIFAQTSEPEVPETFSNFEPAMAADTTTFTNAGETKAFTNAADLDDDVELEIFHEPKIENFENSAVEAATKPEPVAATITEPEAVAAATTTAAGADVNENYYQTKNQINNSTYQPLPNKRIPTDDGFRVTVIQETNGKQRNGLLLGALVLMLTVIAGGMVFSLFNHPLLIGAIGDDLTLSVPVVTDDVPMPVEEEPKPKADKDSGGGGGGGREEETPTSRGRLAPQMPDPPLITPTKTIPQKDFELKMQATTVGNKPAKPSDENYGDPNAKYGLNPSDGMGKGGGQGSGSGTGQGSGKGLGQGSGNGSGSGNGDGDGNGNGRGSGNTSKSDPPPAPPEKPVGVTEKIKFISKPKASYTDQARTNQVQGTVRLRITFSASGQIGSIAPVSGLPYGLTEQAIAAARQIRFEPAKRNGVPIPTTAVVEYNFNIY